MDQHDVWERIGPSFHATRERTWNHVVSFLESLPPGRVLDLMCGNGRHMEAAVAAGHDSVGLDFSRPLCRFASLHAPAVAGDATALPFGSGSFDACTYVAGLHGIPEAQGRAKSLAELYRVLRPGGVAQVTVWWRAAPRFAALDSDGPVDVVIPWKAAGLDAQRAYHLYTEVSLEAVCVEAGFNVEIIAPVQVAAQSPDNLVAIVERPE